MFLLVVYSRSKRWLFLTMCAQFHMHMDNTKVVFGVRSYAFIQHPFVSIYLFQLHINFCIAFTADGVVIFVVVVV